MPMADVLALVQTLSNGAADGTATPDFYSDTMIELAEAMWFTQASTFSNAIGDRTFDFTSLTPIDISAIIYNDSELDEASLLEIEMIDSQWRDAQNRTTTFIVEDENAKVVAPYPRPDEAHTTNTLFYTFAPTDPFYYLELAIAMRILEREMGRESDHCDMQMASLCGMVGKFFMSLVA
jgi:hypothetical protein